MLCTQFKNTFATVKSSCQVHYKLSNRINMSNQRLLLNSFICTLFLLISFSSKCAVSAVYNSSATESFSPASPYLKASVFVNLKRVEFEKMIGRKLGFLERMYFKSTQKKLKQELKNDSDLLITKYYDDAKGKFKIDGVWFVIGSIIGPLGILFAYTSKQPKNNKISAMLGTVIFIIWFGYLVLF